MKELFRFVSVKKFDTIKKPWGAILTKDSASHTNFYSKALIAKDKKESDTIRASFFSSISFVKEPLSVNNNLTGIYRKIGVKTPLVAAEINSLCKDITGVELKDFVSSSHFKGDKAVIVENLYFLISVKEKNYSQIKIQYKHLLKCIGLLEAIVNKNDNLEKILSNPSLQYFDFDSSVFKDSNAQSDNDKNDELKEYKNNLLKEYDDLLELKNAQEELLKLHQKNKRAVSEQIVTTAEKENVSAGFFARLFRTSDSNIEKQTGSDLVNRKNILISRSDLSSKTQKALSSIGVEIAEIDAISAINSLESQIIHRGNNLNSSVYKPQLTNYQGRTFLSDRDILFLPGITDKLKDNFIKILDSMGDTDVPSGSPAVPSSYGFAKILGEGRLLKVEEEYKGCKLANLATVINIPAGAKKSYEDRYLSKTVTTTESESTESTFDESFTESNIQNNLSNEISKVQEFDLSLEAGLNVSANYGPVGVEASSDFSTSVSNSETTNSASSYARDLTQRAIKRIEKRNREAFKAEKTIENEIKNIEGYENNTPNHTVGIYQWINEIYKAKLIQYESRLLLEFMVPEPGNLLLFAANSPNVSKDDTLPVPPAPFNIGINDIKPENYKQFVKLWGATDIAPPPQKIIVVSKSLSGPEKTDNSKDPIHMKLSDESLTIPEGYNLDYVEANFSCTSFYISALERNFAKFDVIIGTQHKLVPTSERGEYIFFDFNQRYNRKNLPIAITGLQARTFVLNIDAYCIASSQAVDKWQIETFAKLKQAYQRLLDDYNDKIALSRQRSLFSGSLGNNPDKNRQIEKEELKRACTSIITNQSFELFDSINDPANRIPKIKFDQVKPEGEYVRFFEHAFEWTQMAYVLYPYFWANPNKTWLRSLNIKLDDPKHEEFLKSGFARVVVPVRPEFQNAILQYLESGVQWDGDNPDDVDLNDPRYIQISTEIMESQGRLEQSSEVLDEWEFELPTNHQIITNGLNLPKPPFV